MKLDSKIQTSNNLSNFAKSYGNCFGMTMSYIRNSERYGGISASWQIDNGVITQARLINQWSREQEVENIQNAGFSVLNSYSDYANFGYQEGYYVIIIDGPAHAMGAMVKNNKYQFFDPNSGVHHAVSSDDLYNGVWSYLHSNYPGWTLRHIIAVSA